MQAHATVKGRISADWERLMFRVALAFEGPARFWPVVCFLKSCCVSRAQPGRHWGSGTVPLTRRDGEKQTT